MNGMELNYKQLKDLIDYILYEYKQYINECNTMSAEQKVAVLETILSDVISNYNGGNRK